MNIATHSITNTAIELNICKLLDNNLLLTTEDKSENRNANKGYNNILSKEEFTTTGTNL